ncbi:beta-ketoacyl-[acyl-carrier-protein] synthase family protein [Noviherbaspirillum aridicola]|uniref:Beta-ketoacyl-[acyl-carrier-protein] synthase II n=1 Tax=Noviherbaspirillum aridicola TaxID=2849687 RepID=A0ABQ4Q6Z2_9BURK|nr:beta-ketoacyl-[acyl-carrier-protein] synthase family protein [Noviherbaspirillum aridicola]GIZ52555.1 beta-ketoacyl-[acyl-carrier-protein] synthase II [Noviherbaspirillum aridicola]
MKPLHLSPLHLAHFTAASCIGRGQAEMLEALRTRRSGLRHCDFDDVDLDTWIGAVEGVDEVAMRADVRDYDCRNNRLLQMALELDGFRQAVEASIARHGTRRVGVFLGTSTSGILETEHAYRRRDPGTGALPPDFRYRQTHSTFSAAEFARACLGLAGPAFVVSSACSSSAKAFASARRMMAAGLIDAAIVGGVDSLCLTTLYGFNSLGLTSAQPCRPYAADRSGISIGEAAALVLLEAAPPSLDADAVLVTGIGESSDAHHMSSPHPEGAGARLAMEQALRDAGLRPDQIDYINLHGTATPSNDASEGKAVAGLFGAGTPCSSTKGATGHTLGAAGGLEAVISALALRHGFMPGGVNTAQVDPALRLDYLLANRDQPLRHVLSNSFGFGGTNCSLVLSRAN